MTTRIAPGVGANLLGQHSAERNQDATVYVGNLDPQVSEELLWELFVQAGPVVNVYVPKDRVTNLHQGYGFVEFRSEDDADYAIKVLNMIKLYGKPIRVNKASQDKKSLDVGANLFIGNLDPDVDEKLLYDTFSAFGVIVANPKIMRDPDTGNSRGFGFISYDSFEASDAAIEAMNGQYLCNRQITVSYAYKKDTKGERHGTPAERLLAANNPNSQKSRPHTLFASGPPTLANAPRPNALPPRPFANGNLPPVPIQAVRPPPPPPQAAAAAAYQPPPPAQAAWPPQPQQHGFAVPPPMQFRPAPQGMPLPPALHQQVGSRPPPPPQAMGIGQSQHMWPGGPPMHHPPPHHPHHHHHMSMPPPPTHSIPPPPPPQG
ncbi:PREDICTED: splicing factor 3B subunit 4-like [Tarenaya hassleriana]|uniref:splicing factor 3B subunit 4-like n=1 Tax=Tarenaya hassleriana TaxID=28532 RepID=UPI00053C4956|nr:PREDICTED: splicing factor 3B subunit 4-like [Tarenaya hassleriana]